MGQAQLAVITSRKITPANLIIEHIPKPGSTATTLVPTPVLISSGLDNETALCANEIPLRWSSTHELQIYPHQVPPRYVLTSPQGHFERKTRRAIAGKGNGPAIDGQRPAPSTDYCQSHRTISILVPMPIPSGLDHEMALRTNEIPLGCYMQILSARTLW
jgi:hypothetical protein